MEEKDKKIKLFQFFKELELPIFIKIDCSRFSLSTTNFLKELHFSELTEQEEKNIFKNLAKLKAPRILSIEEANHQVSKSIDAPMEDDRFGAESITIKPGHKVYRYKHHALMVYSMAALEWRLGTFTDFADKKNTIIARSIINRFLTWALVPHGILGFWGVPVDEGMVVLKQIESNAEVVFVDLYRRQLLSQDGIREIRGRFKILRLDPKLKGRNIKMNSEELLSFLSHHTSFFDYVGLSVPVRQIIQTLARNYEGVLHPQESFKPRTDLSL